MYWLVLICLPSLAFAARPGVSSSRRLLASALVLLVPFAGLVLAFMVRRSRGGIIAPEPELADDEPMLTSADVARLAEEAPIVDRLVAGDPGDRLAALVALSSAGDADAVEVLRWTVEHGSSDVVLDAALTLEELELRCESRLTAAQAALTAAPGPSAGLALAVAHAAEALVLNRLADAALAPRLALTAREAYARALAWAPERATEIERDLARLTAAVGRNSSVLATAVAPAQPTARRASGEIDLTRRTTSPTPRRVSGVFQVREVAAAALLT